MVALSHDSLRAEVQYRSESVRGAVHHDILNKFAREL